MALLIQVPDAAHSGQIVSLNAQEVDLTFRWNTIADAWSLDVALGDVVLCQGATFKSDRDFTSKYISMTNQLGGFFYCQRKSKDSTTPLNRDSFSSDIDTHRILFIEL